MPPAPRRLLVYAALAVAFTWPLALHPTSTLAALEGPGDPYLNLWILGWNLRTIAAHPSALLNGAIFDANIFHPARDTLAYSDHLILQSLLMWPLYAATGDVVLCYNMLLLFSLLASALAMHLFVRYVTGSEAGAYAAGLAWGFGPYRFAHLIHLQLQALYWLPLAFLFLHRLAAGRRRIDAFGLGATIGLQAIASVYWGVIGSMGLICGTVALMLGIGGRPAALMLRRLVLAAAVAAVLVAPFVVPYLRVQRREGFARNLFEASHGAARVSSYLQPPPVNLLYGRTGLLPRASDASAAGPERELFPGFLLMALAVVGTYHARRRGSGPLLMSMGVLVALGFTLSLGPDGCRPFYSALHRFVFGFQAVRAPARFAVLVVFGLAVLAALAVRELAMASRAGRAVRILPIALVSLLALEFANAPIPYAAAPPRHTADGEWLRKAAEPGAVLYLPLNVDVTMTHFMVRSLEHGRPIVNGYSGQRPAFYTALADAMVAFPSGESLWALRDLDVRYVVASSPLAVPDRGSPLVERQRFPDASIYELRWTPEAEAALTLPAAPAPPDPGPPPFRAGETAVYSIAWKGGLGPMGLSAGSATVRVDRPDERQSNLAYRLELAAETADWVSTFFEARDRFETGADARLLPIVHRQELREGRRRLDRTVFYDHAGRTVRVVSGPASNADARSEVTLPLSPGARDSLSAFFYARTLPLEPGSTVRVPINDAGRNLILELRSSGPEAVDHGGRRIEALRLEPRLVYRLERREPVQAVVWLSLDERRIPLVIEVTAGFGVIRAELASYRR